MNSGGFKFYPNISKSKKEPEYKAENLYNLLLWNPDKALRDILYKDYRSQCKDLLSQGEVLFDLREEILKKLSSKELTKRTERKNKIKKTRIC